MTLSKEAILAASDLKMKTIPVPEWGGEVCIRVMTGAERDAYAQELHRRKTAASGAPPGVGLNPLLVSFCVCDETGKPLFTLEDTTALGAKNWAVLERVAEEIAKHNWITAEAVERAEKN